MYPSGEDFAGCVHEQIAFSFEEIANGVTAIEAELAEAAGKDKPKRAPSTQGDRNLADETSLLTLVPRSGKTQRAWCCGHTPGDDRPPSGNGSQARCRSFPQGSLHCGRGRQTRAHASPPSEPWRGC